MISVEFNDSEIEAALDNLAAALTDMSPVMNDIGIALVVSTEQRDADTKTPDGSQWAPRSDVTLANHVRRGESFGPVLHKSGTLRQFIDHQYGLHEVTIASNEVYSAVQQFGAEQGAFGAAVGRTKPSAKRKTSQDYFVPIPWGKSRRGPSSGFRTRTGWQFSTSSANGWSRRRQARSEFGTRHQCIGNMHSMQATDGVRGWRLTVRLDERSATGDA